MREYWLFVSPSHGFGFGFEAVRIRVNYVTQNFILNYEF
jgi:hypothetical protein